MDVFSHPWLGAFFGDAEIAALQAPEVCIAHMLAIEAAQARVLGFVDAAKAIAGARIAPEVLANGTARDGLPVPALVRSLKRQIDPDLHEGIHQGLTSQDVMDTAQILIIRDVIKVLERRNAELEGALEGLSAQHGAAALMGQTRMQAALPITVADRIATWRIPLADHAARLAELKPRLLKVQMGGPVGVENSAELARELGLPSAPKAWHAMRDTLGEFAGWLSLVTGTLGKMGQDIALMSQQGTATVVLADGGTSSAMQHKNNPVLAELLVTLARYNATQLSGMHQALVHENERSGSAWALEWMILPQMKLATGRSLTAAIDLVERIERIGDPKGG